MRSERQRCMQGRYIVALKETVDHRYVTNLLQKRFPEYEIYTGKEGPCVDLIDISRVCMFPYRIGLNEESLLKLKCDEWR